MPIYLSKKIIKSTFLEKEEPPIQSVIKNENVVVDNDFAPMFFDVSRGIWSKRPPERSTENLIEDNMA